jgi:hypothetical protein
MDAPKPAGTFDPAISAKKAGMETVYSVLSVVGAALLGLLFEPTFMDAVRDAVKDNPRVLAMLPAIFVGLRFAIKFLIDRKKHKDPSYHIEHGMTPAKAEQAAVASGADPVEAKKETKVAVIEQEKP